MSSGPSTFSSRSATRRRKSVPAAVHHPSGSTWCPAEWTRSASRAASIRKERLFTPPRLHFGRCAESAVRERRPVRDAERPGAGRHRGLRGGDARGGDQRSSGDRIPAEGIEDVICEGENGRLVSSGDAGGFAATILCYDRDRCALRDASLRARGYVRNTSSWPVIADRYHHALCSAADRKEGDRGPRVQCTREILRS